MFANFLYFLVALIIYSTSQISLHSQSPPKYAILLTVFLTGCFAAACQIFFKQLEKKTDGSTDLYIDHLLNRYTANLSILSLFIFSIIIYFIKLPLVFSENILFQTIPTLKAVCFLALFLLYLVIVWASSYRVHQKISPGSISRKALLGSHISFSLPALLPWFIISIVADLIQFLPYEPLKSYLLTSQGEIVFILLFLVPIAIFGPVLIARAWGCTPLPAGGDRNFIEQVCAKAGLQYKNILKWNLFGGSMITAGVMGLIKKFRYILVTPALMNVLNPAEIEAVILHEIGHVQKKHMLFYLVFFAGFLLCIYFSIEPLLLLIYLFVPIHKIAGFSGLDAGSIMPVFLSLLLIGFFISYFRYVFGFFMRNFERQADIHVYSFMDNSWPLISTFHKITAYSRQSPDQPNWHHFSISERIRFLKNCQQYPEFIQQHHQKIKKMIAGYLLIMSIICFTGYSVSYGILKLPFESFVTQQLLLQQLKINPDRSDLYVMIADYYYAQENFYKARDAYENVLNVDPENVHALNNLSWLLSTCPDPDIIDAEKALKLARKAVAIQPDPHILDTYAQACFINHDYGEAVRASKEALDKASEKKEYYKKQYLFFKENHRLVSD